MVDGRTRRQGNANLCATPSESAHDQLVRFIQLARDYRGWSRSQLARALGRDPTKLVPRSGNPKLDLVVRLAEVMDWPVGDLALQLYEPLRDDPLISPMSCADSDMRDELARCVRCGEFESVPGLARRLYAGSNERRHRAEACLHEAIGWAEGRGRFDRVVQACVRGLHINAGDDDDLRLLLLSHLARAHFHLDELGAARTVVDDVLTCLAGVATCENLSRAIHEGQARYVRAWSGLRSAQRIGRSAASIARSAEMDARRAHRLFELIRQTRPESLRHVHVLSGHAQVLALHASALSGSEQPPDVCARLMELAAATKDDDEVRAWAVVHATELAFGVSADGAVPASRVTEALFEAREIAEVADNWPLRERVWTLDDERRSRLARRRVEADPVLPWLLETADVRTVVGLIARFPAFRERGWSILDASRVVR